MLNLAKRNEYTFPREIFFSDFQFVMVQVNVEVKPVAIDLVPVVRELIEQKLEIEKEMDTIGNTLNSDASANVGINKPLVDSEGFPLPGVDHHQVRALRNRFACLRTDLDELYIKIESSLHEIHEAARLTDNVSVGDRHSLVPFGRVEVVAPGSAAEDAGLLVGDKLVSFGPISCYSAESVDFCYDSIPGIVKRIPLGESLDLKVRRVGRDNEDILISLLPKDGKIGCLIKAV